ncbi:MAG: NAD(P)/FAD-dependent oxidoreductase, partial [Clostridiales bacterium]|nr:NAD(P)/FAD-dependent oxidoreductase [Clostridiales bacterium]
MTEKSLVIIGCGPGGMSAALAARENGIQDILILERDNRPGGIMNQCIHSGFGIKYFGEELTGTEYALRVFDKIQEQGIELRLNTMVTDITPEKVITALTAGEVIKIKAGAIILAMGCRERPRGAINIKGTRPAGVIT